MNSHWTSETAPKGTGKRASKYVYTLKDVARITGRSIHTVKNDIAKKTLNLHDIENVSQYIQWAKINREIRTSQKGQ